MLCQGGGGARPAPRPWRCLRLRSTVAPRGWLCEALVCFISLFVMWGVGGRSAACAGAAGVAQRLGFGGGEGAASSPHHELRQRSCEGGKGEGPLGLGQCPPMAPVARELRGASPPRTAHPPAPPKPTCSSFSASCSIMRCPRPSASRCCSCSTAALCSARASCSLCVRRSSASREVRAAAAVFCSLHTRTHTHTRTQTHAVGSRLRRSHHAGLGGSRLARRCSTAGNGNMGRVCVLA